MFLYELGVGEPARRQGIGRSLVEALAALAKERGCYDMWTGTDTDNVAARATLRTSRGPDEPTPADGRMGLRRRGPTTQPIATAAFAEGAASADARLAPLSTQRAVCFPPPRDLGLLPARWRAGALDVGCPARDTAARASGRPGAPRWVLSTPSRYARSQPGERSGYPTRLKAQAGVPRQVRPTTVLLPHASDSAGAPACRRAPSHRRRGSCWWSWLSGDGRSRAGGRWRPRGRASRPHGSPSGRSSNFVSVLPAASLRLAASPLALLAG